VFAVTIAVQPEAAAAVSTIITFLNVDRVDSENRNHMLHDSAMLLFISMCG
jgi:hypothetical protein